ncbi:hypothetical protein [Spirosoma foliorum]|uniref:Uncharacterized protein n=1 Tax=Spirosoma foliorum TaxID=2710596 RepID=A0A7G5GS44_9BACT|nr:hypothetical protein [Spirosoma foliorum]QMW01686.1 hypothetical protein H3H32_27600 [Spirosoma foliorum]
MAYLKKVWLIYWYGQGTLNLSEEDYYKIESLSGIKFEYLKKVLRADNILSSYKPITLNNLCKAISSVVRNFPDNWQYLADQQILNNVYEECGRLEKKVKRKTNLIKYDDNLVSRIHDAALIHASRFYYLSSTDTVFEAEVIDDYLFPVIQMATEGDVYKIDNTIIPSNPFLSRVTSGRNNIDYNILPFWQKNPNTIYVIHDEQGQICANLNILPLKRDCYQKIRDGIISENEIQPQDLYSPKERDLAQYIYIEDFFCSRPNYVSLFLNFLSLIFDRVTNSKKEDIVIGAIGGTEKGQKLMKRLKFELVTKGVNSSDEHDFYELDYKKLPEAYRNLNLLTQHVENIKIEASASME